MGRARCTRAANVDSNCILFLMGNWIERELDLNFPELTRVRHVAAFPTEFFALIPRGLGIPRRSIELVERSGHPPRHGRCRRRRCSSLRLGRGCRRLNGIRPSQQRCGQRCATCIRCNSLKKLLNVQYFSFERAWTVFSEFTRGGIARFSAGRMGSWNTLAQNIEKTRRGCSPVNISCTVQVPVLLGSHGDASSTLTEIARTWIRAGN